MSRDYTTLSGNNQSLNHIYHDRDSLQYNAAYPIIELNDDFIKASDNPKKIETYLLQNFWYQKGNSVKRKDILDRVVHLNKNLKIILDFINEKYGSLGFKCLHISTAGSYIYSDCPGDIDLDVIVSGSFFDYTTFNEGIELVDIVGTVKKISVTVMGEDNILGKQKVIDNIENDGFLHQDTIIRELLVAPMRNVTIYGKPFDNRKNIDGHNVLVRVARQLYFASLTIQGKIPYYEEEPLRTKKALSRINEAHEIIEWLLNTDSYLERRN
jgi:hypothetical protein